MTAPLGTQDATVKTSTMRAALDLETPLPVSCDYYSLQSSLSEWRNMLWFIFLFILFLSQWIHRVLLSEQRYMHNLTSSYRLCMHAFICKTFGPEIMCPVFDDY